MIIKIKKIILFCSVLFLIPSLISCNNAVQDEQYSDFIKSVEQQIGGEQNVIDILQSMIRDYEVEIEELSASDDPQKEEKIDKIKALIEDIKESIEYYKEYKQNN